MKKVNIIIGRYQPFHKGHYSLIEKAWKDKGVPTVICMIDVPEDKVDERHPFPTSMLLPLYESWFKKDPKVEKIIKVKNADIVKVHEELGDDYQIVSLTCGTDRFQAYQWMYKYKEQAKTSDDFEILEVKRGEEDYSATKARQALLDDNRNAFLRMVPTIGLSARLKNDLFAELREQILKVVNKE